MMENTNGNLDDLLEQLKAAFGDDRLDEAKALIGKVRALDPENGMAGHIEKKVQAREARALREANQEKIDDLEDRIKLAFKEVKFDQVRLLAEQLKKLDPENKAAVKWVEKAQKEETEVKEKAARVRAQAQAEARETKEKAEKEALRLKEKAEQEARKVKEEAEKHKAKEAAVALKRKEKQEKEAAKAKKRAEEEALKAERAKNSPPGFFSRLFAGKRANRPDAKQVPAKAPEAKTPLIRLESAKPQAIAARPQTAQRAAEGQKTEERPEGNIFTSLFKKKQEETKEESIIDTIVAQSGEKAKEEKEKREQDPWARRLTLARLTLQFAVAFVVLTGAFLFTQIVDQKNTVLGLLGVESNYASRLHGAGEQIREYQDQKKALEEEIARYKKGYSNPYQKTIRQVVGKRIDWTDVMNKVNEIADAVYPHNALSQYIKFSSYDFDADDKKITVSGTLSDPLGQNLTKLFELEEAFRYYPKDKDNPDDATAPYFYAVEGSRNVGKSLSSQTNKYVSNFRFTFYLEDPSKKSAAKVKKK